MSGAQVSAALAADRSQTWWLLSRTLLERPGPELLQELSAALAAVPEDSPLSGDCGELSGLLSEKAHDALSEELGPEYTRLLRGIREGVGPPPPYESLYRGGGLMNDFGQSAVASYASAGFGDIFAEAGPQDHLGVELRFMSLLCYREMEAWQEGDPVEAGAVRSRQEAFLQDHLLAWLPGFSERVAEYAKMGFYPALMQLVEAFCRQEMTALVMPDEAMDVA